MIRMFPALSDSTGSFKLLLQVFEIVKNLNMLIFSVLSVCAGPLSELENKRILLRA
jgi:hypothetical protein